MMDKGPLAGLEPLCIETPLNAGEEPDGGAVGYAILSIAISLKRIADIAETAVPPHGETIVDRLGGTLQHFSDSLYHTLLNARN